MPNLITPILSDIENISDIQNLVDTLCMGDHRRRVGATELVLSRLVVELAKQNRELSERVARLENTLAELGNNA